MSAAPSGLARRALRRSDVVHLYGASLRSVDRAVRAGEIRAKKRGQSVFLHPDDVERVFGFPDDTEPVKVSAESVAELEGFLA